MYQGVPLGGEPTCYLDTTQAAAVLGLSPRTLEHYRVFPCRHALALLGGGNAPGALGLRPGGRGGGAGRGPHRGAGGCGGACGRAGCGLVGGDGIGVGHGRAPGEWMSRPKRLWTTRPSPGPSPAFALAGSGQTDGWMAPVLAMRKPSADRRVTPQEGGAGKAVGTSATGPALSPGEHLVVENWRDCQGLPDNGHIHPVIERNRGDLRKGLNGSHWGERMEFSSG